MGHEITHMGVVDGRLCARFPGFVSRLVIGKYADDIDGIEITKFGALQIDKLAAENEMKKLFVIVRRHEMPVDLRDFDTHALAKNRQGPKPMTWRQDRPRR
jgi:hypothetical protein